MKRKPIHNYTTTCAIASKDEYNPAYGVCPFCLEVYIGVNSDFYGEGIICHKCGALLKMGTAYLPEDGDTPFRINRGWVDARYIHNPERAVQYMQYAATRKDPELALEVAKAIVQASRHWGKNKGRWFVQRACYTQKQRIKNV